MHGSSWGRFGWILLLVAHSAGAQEASVWEGVYTAQQAAAGADLYAQHCIACHGDGTGAAGGHGPVPALVGADFEYRWLEAAVGDLFDTLRQTMPEAAPNSLSATEYAAITAYLLQRNGYPTGAVKLDPAQRDTLLNTYIEARPPVTGEASVP